MLSTLGRAFAGDVELSERQGATVVALAGVAFSFTAIAFRGVEDATDWQFLAYRGGSTTVVLLTLIWLRRRSHPVRFDSMSRRVVLASLVLASTSMLYILALSRTTAATTLFLLAAAPVAAALFGWLLLRERVEPDTVWAIGIVAAGVAIMVGAGLDAGSATGVILAALIPILLGLYNVLLRSAPETDPVLPAALAGVFLWLTATVIALIGSGLTVSWRDGALACLTGGGALGIGLPLFNLGHRSVVAARVPLLLMTEIVLAPLWVWIWPGETPAAGTLVGGAVVMATVAWLLLRASDVSPAPVPTASS